MATQRHIGWATGFVALFALAGCPELRAPIEPDLIPPRVLGVKPSGNAVAVDTRFEVQLSEAIQRSTLTWLDDEFEEHPDGIVLALAENQEYLDSALKSPPLSVTQRAKTIPAEIELSLDRRSIFITPNQTLSGLTTYVIIVSEELRDDKYNKLATDSTGTVFGNHTVEFTTQSAPDRTKPIASLQSPPTGATNVAIDLRTVEVVFSEPIDENTLRPERIGLTERDSQQALTPANVTLEGNVATLVLGPRAGQGCDTLCTETTYDLFVTPEVRDLAGNQMDQGPLGNQSFRSAACFDSDAPRLPSSSLAVQAADVSAVMTWRTDEPSGSEVQYVQGDAAALLAACDPTPSAACLVVTGEAATCAAGVDVCNLPDDPTAFSCAHSVRLRGLVASRGYAWRAVSADPGGRRGKSEAATFTTQGELPRVRVSEIFISPNTPLTTSSEFIELHNAGTAAIDLAGWKLARCTDNNCSGLVEKQWTLKAAATGGSTTLEPGSFALATGDSFSGSTLGVPAATVLLHGSTATLVSGGLRDTNSDGYALLNPDNIIVSSYGGYLAGGGTTGKKGRSFERKLATDPDEAANWAVSTSAVAGATGNFATPGTKNSVSP